MSAEQERFVAFLGVMEQEEEAALPKGALLFSSSLDEARKWKASLLSGDEGELKKEDKNSKPDGNKLPPKEDVSISNLIKGCINSLSSYHSLISVGSFMKGSFPWMAHGGRIVTFASQKAKVLEHDGCVKIYGITSDLFPDVKKRLDNLNEMRRGMSVLPGSILLSLVSTFDSYFSDMVRAVLTRRPERYNNSDRQLTVKEILQMSSFDDVRNKIIDDEIDGLMRGSHDDQVKFVERNLSVNVRDVFVGYPEYLEIFERRNLVAHGKNIINSIYLKNCEKFGVDVSKWTVGDSVGLSPAYLHKSVDVLVEFSIILGYLLWKKHFCDLPDKPTTLVSGLAFDLITGKRYNIASHLYEFLLKDKGAGLDDSAKKTNIINLANCYKNLGEEEKCINLLNETDWSASADKFRICVASLQEDIKEVVELMPLVAPDHIIGKADLKSWPVFDWVRKNEEVCRKFEEIFGEPMEVSAKYEPNSSTAADPSEVEGGGAGAESPQTVH